MPVTFFNWQTSRLAPGAAPYSRLSPNLEALRDELGKRFGGSFNGGFGVRPTRGSSSPSSHGFGAAIDWRLSDSAARSNCLAWLVQNYEVLGIQAIHDYSNSRIWRANRYPGQSPLTWWRPQPANAGTGMGQAWAVWLHIETDRSNWSNDTPIANRGSVSTNPPPPLPQPVLFDPANGVWGLYPLNPNKKTLRETATPPTPEDFDLTRYLQGVLRLKASQPITVDGDFGPSTDQAVRNLQKFLGMVVDGVVGPKTWAVIDSLSGK
jgi:hypothetical protein